MTREFDDSAQEPRDFTKYVWAGVGILVIVMVVLMLTVGKSAPKRSEVKTRHLLIKFDPADPADRARALELIQGLREQIVSGKATLAELAEKYSDDESSASRGGFLGTSGKGDMQQQYEDYSWSAPLHELSGIIQTSFGYHLMVVEDRYISPADAYEKELERKIQESGGNSTAETAEGAAPPEAAAPPESTEKPVE